LPRLRAELRVLIQRYIESVMNFADACNHIQ
jgi:hypothetical protein